MNEKIFNNLNEALKGKKLIRIAHTLDEGLEQTVLPIPQEIWYKYPTLGEDHIKTQIPCFRPFPNRDRDRFYTYDHVIWKMMAMKYIEKMEEEPLFFCYKNSTNLEEACKEFGFKELMPDYKLYKDLQNKSRLHFYGVDEMHGMIPHIEAKLSEVNYEELRNKMGDMFVIQFSFNKKGWNTSGGRDTFFVHNKEEFESIKSKDYENPAKIAKFIKGPALAVNCIATGKGTIVGDPFIQAIGIPELTDRQSMYCGADYSYQTHFSQNVFDQIINITKHIGNKIYAKQFKGSFGIDFLLDETTEKVYVTEINPRMTGSTNHLTFLSHHLAQIPAIALHFCTYLDCMPESFNVEEYEKVIRGTQIGGKLVIRNREEKIVQIKSAPKPGVYKYTENRIEFVKDGYHIGHINDTDHFLVRCIHPLKRNFLKTNAACEIQTLDSILKTPNELHSKYIRIINEIYSMFTFTEENTYDSSVLYEAM